MQRKYSMPCAKNLRSMSIPDFETEFCGTLPINQINHVQSYGCLVITDHRGNIVQVSDNIQGCAGIESNQFVGVPLREHFAEDVIDEITARLSKNLNARFPVTLTLRANSERVFTGVVSANEQLIFIELESIDRPQTFFAEAYQNISTAFAAVESAATYSEVLERSAEILKRLSGFDKVMIYKFDENWNGNVVAEAMEPGMESYLGLRFPASDIPRPAREMYKRNPYRLIVDINYEPVQLYPLVNPVSKGFVDISSCNLRGVARVHLEYLRNMGVTASMSTRILKNNQLWGLISCHHRKPYTMPYEQCILFELVSNIISARLTAVEIAEDTQRNFELQSVASEIYESLYSERSFRAGLMKAFSPMLSYFDGGGIVYIRNNQFYSEGMAPDKAQLSDLCTWLHAKNFQEPWHTASLGGHFAKAMEFSDVASGLLVFPLLNAQDEYVLVFRPETGYVVKWGGNPNEALTFEDATRTKYHPRNSFELWKEHVKNKSIPFAPHVVRFANDLHRLMLSLRLAEQHA